MEVVLRSPRLAGEVALLFVGFLFLGFLLRLQLLCRRDQLRRLVTFAVAILKQLGLNDSLSVNQNRAGVWEASLKVQPVGLNRLAARIGQKRQRDFETIAETLQDADRIEADSDHLDASVFESFAIFLQLDQLPFAVRSPVG